VLSLCISNPEKALTQRAQRKEEKGGEFGSGARVLPGKIKLGYKYRYYGRN
jgi:hypothetical protein